MGRLSKSGVFGGFGDEMISLRPAPLIFMNYGSRWGVPVRLLARHAPPVS